MPKGSREAHFGDLSTPWFNNCACHACYVQRRVEAVSLRLKGIKRLNLTPFQRALSTYQFGFSDWKTFAQEAFQHDDTVDALRYIVPTVR